MDVKELRKELRKGLGGCYQGAELLGNMEEEDMQDNGDSKAVSKASS